MDVTDRPMPWWRLLFGPAPAAGPDAVRWLGMQFATIGVVVAAPFLAVLWILLSHAH